VGEVFGGEEPGFEGGDGTGGEFAAGFSGFGAFFASVFVIVFGSAILVVGVYGG